MSATEKLYELPSSLGKERGLSLHSLLGTLYISLSTSSLLRTTIQYFKNQTVRLLYPTYSHKYVASCTTSVYVNLSKNSFTPSVFRKAGAKVRTFSELPKLFQENFHLLCKKHATLDKYQGTKWHTPYYI